MDCYVPSYYKRFKCIADRCRHSCCVGWAVYIDGNTRALYESLDSNLGCSLRAALCDDGDGAYLKMHDGRCPMLDNSGLCRIISTLGEGALCEICARHPRFINLVGDRCEVGLGISCEEAARIVLLDNEPFSLVKCNEAMERWGAVPKGEIPIGAALSHKAIKAATDAESYCEIGRTVLDSFGARYDFHTDSEWLDFIYELEYLDDEWHGLIARRGGVHTDFENRDRILKNLLIYLIYRHTPEAKSEEEFRARLSLAGLCAHLCDILFDIGGVASIDAALDICRSFSSEIEYSEDNLDELLLEFECFLPR